MNRATKRRQAGMLLICLLGAVLAPCACSKQTGTETMNAGERPEAETMNTGEREGLQLAGFVLAHAIWKADGDAGEIVVPFSMTDSGGNRELQVYAVLRLEDGVSRGRTELQSAQPNIDGWALAFAGTEKITGTDVIIVEVWRNEGFECRVIQGYKPKDNDRDFALAGKPEIAINGRLTENEDLSELLFRGIETHTEARHYWDR